MPGTERDVLRDLLMGCDPCNRHFMLNAGTLLSDDDGELTDAQVVAVLIEMRKVHAAHPDVH